MIPTEYLPTLRQLRSLGVDLNALVDGQREEPAVGPRPVVLNEGQLAALAKVKAWLEGSDQFFALRGFAGTGKSTLMREVSQLDYNTHFSAPTNQATKVLSEFLGFPCKTTYSLLGLRMVTEEDHKVLSLGGPKPDLGTNPILVIDEAGMLQKDVIDILIKTGHRILFVGDPAQLNPIGETISKAWRIAGSNRVTLTKVERFDNQLLKASVDIRACLKDKEWTSPLVNDNSGTGGVFVTTRRKFERLISALPIEAWDEIKICCWRNRTVDGYNNLVRAALGFEDDFNVGDRILLASPLSGIGGSVVAHTDERFVVFGVDVRDIAFTTFTVRCHVLDVGRGFVLNVPVDPADFTRRASKMANHASSLRGYERKEAWAVYWSFVETFAKVRYGYGMTAHRLQGSSLDTVFLDQSDILANPNKAEAFRALYVGATRPRKSLITF